MLLFNKKLLVALLLLVKKHHFTNKFLRRLNVAHAQVQIGFLSVGGIFFKKVMMVGAPQLP
jgi:hypothetical protein